MRLARLPWPLAITVLAACGGPGSAGTGQADAWLGKWAGPEGTSLQIAGGQGNYEITVRNLDGPRTFTGHASESGIEFERDGMTETISATNGAGTGMKWLTEKTDCLVIRPGEGFCRD